MKSAAARKREGVKGYGGNCAGLWDRVGERRLKIPNSASDSLFLPHEIHFSQFVYISPASCVFSRKFWLAPATFLYRLMMIPLSESERRKGQG